MSQSEEEGAARSWIESQYALWQQTPEQVDTHWQAYFSALEQGTSSPRSEKGLPGQVAVLRLINAYRFLGHRVAHLDPLERHPLPEVPELTLDYHGLVDIDEFTSFETGSLVGPSQALLSEILTRLRRTYCGTVGVEYMYLTDTAQKRWIQQCMENPPETPDPRAQRTLLAHLSAAETLERYLHSRFVGQKRFSLEGGESLIPCLNTLIHEGRAKGIEEIVIGMAHRGRLNVLVNCLGRLPRDLFLEFEGVHETGLTSGDVKYHQGFSSDVETPAGSVHVALAFNPSHLEVVNPVVEGSVRARQDRRGDTKGQWVLPVLIHGDAALSGQGVVMETLALSQTRGFSTGGTLHIVINNQIGFTTSDPRDTRSSTYCTDLAKMTETPVFHVNGDDPEAVLRVLRVALDYRTTFHRDVMVDIVCYRRLGHNEQDEPMVTQPWMYRKIQALPTTRQRYAAQLIQSARLTQEEADAMIEDYRAALDRGELPESIVRPSPKIPYAHAAQWTPYRQADWRTPVDTRLTRNRLTQLAERLTQLPEGFELHSTVRKVVDHRRQMGEGTLAVDWGMGESLAYASLVEEGYGVRLSGQDCGRGTFSHRHAVWHDQNRQRWDAGIHIPLQHISPTQASFTVIDSLLSEEAVLGFEYGYASAQPRYLVLWEAQFGDFANGAQVVIDQFISSAEAKWGRLCGLTLLLPHGYEGQGPEHSSARVERYLQLCADYNLQVCIPSTAAQIFHLLRRQMLRPLRKPLIVITPKSLLRRKEASSPLEEFTTGGFQPILAEVKEAIDPAGVQRIVVCSGKVYYDLVAERGQRNIENIAVLRLEQLYPFPHEEFAAQIARYPAAHSVLWCQEEPGNQGAWHRIQHYLVRHLRPDQHLSYALRPSSAAPAVGYLNLHEEQRRAFLEAALTL
ncbi:2-oxoglutarate dehydrogenase E1 component [Ferrovum sp.]|uniref:2-oxoglutarate dehydrogenase E1 component n=1 Tax=Ferrovum sp. TaxID=2609467 RepID=UPI00261FF60C|nr:2-oxoglutarate dehydrogenase E1 component [Ferrovum sp.]